MTLPKFAAGVPTKVENVPPSYALAAMARDQMNGTLLLKSDKIARQFKFSSGNCLGAISNLKSELPGTVLHKEGRLTAEQYETYLTETKQPKANPWEIAKRVGALRDDELNSKKAAHAALLLSAVAASPLVEATFHPDPTPSADPVLIPALRVLVTVASKTSTEEIGKLFVGFVPGSRVIVDEKLEKKLQPLPLDPEEKGLLTVAKNSRTVSEIFEGSFIKKERITFLLFAFGLSGLLTFESAEEAALKAMEASLDETGKAVRKEILTRIQNLDQTSYYEWLGVANTATAEEIKKRGGGLIEKYLAPSVETYFLETEQALIGKWVDKLKEAISVLIQPIQRTEYDAFLVGGGRGSFLQQSVSVKTEAVLREFQEIAATGDFARAIALLEASMASAPSRELLTAFVRTVLKHENPVSANRRTQILAELKKELTKTPKDPTLFELVGEWSIATDQNTQAIDAFSRALMLNPMSSFAKTQLSKLDPKLGTKTTVQAFYRALKSLNHYQLLGVPPSASASAIRASYRKLSRELHPDKFFSTTEADFKEQAKEVYKRIVDAYMTLKDSEKRKEYDQQQISGPGSQAGKTPSTQQGKKYYDLAIAALRQGNIDGAKINLQLGLQAEPENPLFRQKLDEISRQAR